MVTVRFLGHGAFAFDRRHDRADRPVPDRQPQAAASADDIAADAILLTHGHCDHIGDTVAIATRTGASVAAIVELAGELAGDLPRASGP